MSNKKIFATPQDVEAAFYEALEQSDLEAMMTVWAEDEEIVCVLPGGPRLLGYREVREAWRRMFEAGAKLEVYVSQQSAVTTPFAVMHSVIERVQARGRSGIGAPVTATNVFLRGPLGWRMVAHHSSPIPPDSVLEAPKVLH